MGNRLEEIIKEREREKFLSELQSAAEMEGHIPPMPALFLRKIEKPLQYAGGLFLGLFLGMTAIFASFFISVIIFHITL